MSAYSFLPKQLTLGTQGACLVLSSAHSNMCFLQGLQLTFICLSSGQLMTYYLLPGAN